MLVFAVGLFVYEIRKLKYEDWYGTSFRLNYLNKQIFFITVFVWIELIQILFEVKLVSL